MSHYTTPATIVQTTLGAPANWGIDTNNYIKTKIFSDDIELFFSKCYDICECALKVKTLLYQIWSYMTSNEGAVV